MFTENFCLKLFSTFAEEHLNTYFESYFCDMLQSFDYSYSFYHD